MKKAISLTILAASILALIGCGNAGNPLSSTSLRGDMDMAFTLAVENAASGTVTVTKGTTTLSKNITFSGLSTTVKFFDLEAGTWTIDVSLKNSAGDVIFTGSANAEVKQSETTTVAIDVPANEGRLRIIISAPRRPLLWNTLDNEAALSQSEYGPALTAEHVSYAPGMFDGGMRFFASQNSVLHTKVWNEGEKIFGRDEITIELWAQYTAGGTQTLIAGKNSDSSAYILLYQSGNNIYLFAGTSYTYMTYTPDSSFHHYAVSIARGEAVLSIDGSQAIRLPISISLPMPSTIDIGRYVNDTYTIEGVIDNLKIWDYAKTDFSDRTVE